MAALSHFAVFASLSSHNHFCSPLHHSCKPFIRSHQHYYPAISAFSTKKTRKAKSNAELCNDIREFISVVGLPEGHVPSMKELSQHGRQDLANIVRRRGYKLIKQLLSTSIESDENENGKKEGSIELHDTGGKGQYESIGQEQKLEDMNEVVLLSDKVPVEQSHFENANGENSQISFGFDSTSNVALESSLQDKVAKSMKSGELDSFEDDGFDMSHMISADGGNELNKSDDLPKDSISRVEEAFECASGRSNTGKTLNGSITQSKQVGLHASENDSPRDVYLPIGGLATADNNEESDVEMWKRENETEVDRLKFMLHQKEFELSRLKEQKEFELSRLKEQIEKEKMRKRENETEVDRLKFMLHQKEFELSRLKEQIEKEKFALSVLQTEAEKEISKAHKLISEKVTELHAVEEIISDLKEVQVQYMGDGETVQLAGSFNGWHHRITMDPQSPASIVDPIKSRNSKLWSTVLWLYPGTYEIKFVVDGHWRIDPQRETVTTGTFQNNILCVDR